jgi:hypothetical protein
MEVEKAASYATADNDAEATEKMQRKVANEVRLRVRRFTHSIPFTPGWMELLEPVKYLAGIAKQEADGTAAHQQTSKQGSPAASPTGTSMATSTVWERDQVCVRVIVEEGKINLMARSLREFIEMLYSMESSGETLPTEVVQHAQSYEQALGTLIRCCLSTLECLQTLDLTSLLEHISIVLVHAVDPRVKPDASISNELQEVMVIHYLAAIFSQVERLHSDNICSKLAELSIVPLVIRQYEKFKAVVDNSTAAAYMHFFAALADSEFFRSKPQEFFATKEDKKAFALQFDPLAKTLLAQNPGDKKRLRPVTDLIIRWK